MTNHLNPSAAAPLLIAGRQERTKVLGPGVRAVIWTYGCSLNCPGCIAKEMNTAPEYETVAPPALYHWVAKVDGIEGITISGGDPFEQDLPALTAFLTLVKNDSRNLSVMVYTGRLLADWQNHAAARGALEKIDILVDGRYVEALNDGSLWRGSANQQVHFLTPRYAAWRDRVAVEHSREIEISLSPAGELNITGIPRAGFITALTRRLGANGVDFTFEKQ